MPPAGAFRILVVCTGNICRSPMAQAMLTHALRERLGADAAAFEVTSAGTQGLAGWEIEPAAAQVLAELGVKPDPFAARELVADHIAEADLVLCASREHRAAAVTLAPWASASTFTLRELARLAAAVDPTPADGNGSEGDGEGDGNGEDSAARARRRVVEASQLRGYVRPEQAIDDDIADPYGRDAAAFQRAGQEISAAVDAIVGLLTAG